MKIMLLIVATCLLQGCAYRLPDFTKPEMTKQGLFTDQYSCEQEAKRNFSLRQCTTIDTQVRCMMAKGYTPTPETGDVRACLRQDIRGQIYSTR